MLKAGRGKVFPVTGNSVILKSLGDAKPGNADAFNENGQSLQVKSVSKDMIAKPNFEYESTTDV